jgi:hypothetical protein
MTVFNQGEDVSDVHFKAAVHYLALTGQRRSATSNLLSLTQAVA